MTISDSTKNSNTKSDLKSFLENYGTLSAAVAAAAGGPTITAMVKVAPPSPPAPENLASLSSFLSIPFILTCFVLSSHLKSSIRLKISILLLLLTLVSGIAYIWQYQTKTIQLATQDRESAAKSDGQIAKVVYERIVIGSECTADAIKLNPDECKNQIELMRPDILETYKSGGLPGSLWSMSSVNRNTNSLLSAWFCFLAFLSGAMGLLSFKQRSTQATNSDDKPLG